MARKRFARPPGIRPARLEVSLPERRWKLPERPLPVESLLRALDHRRTSIRCVDRDWMLLEQPRLLKRNRDADRLLAGTACGAPNAERLVRMRGEVCRHNRHRDDLNLLGLTPEVGLGHR